MTITFTQDPDGTTGTVNDTTAAGGYPSPNTNRGDAANYLLWSKTDKDGNRVFSNPDIGDVLAKVEWAVATAVSGLYQAFLLRISNYDNAASYVPEVLSGDTITQYESVVYYAAQNKVYRCIQASTGNLPTDTAYWEEVTDLSDVIDNTNIEQEVLNVRSDTLINNCIANRLAKCDCQGSKDDVDYNNQMISRKRAAEINFAAGSIYVYEKIIEDLVATCGNCDTLESSFTLPTPVIQLTDISLCTCDYELVEVDTTGVIITLPFDNKANRNFKGATQITGDKTVLFTDDNFANKFVFYFSLDAARNITFPSSVVYSNALAGWDASTYTWSSLLGGDYRAEFIWDGANWQMDVYGPY